MTDADFVMFLANEETEREGDPLYEKSAPLFMTYIEKRKENADGDYMPYDSGYADDDMVTVFDVYIGIDCTYRSIGKFSTLEEAKYAAAAMRLRLERRMKNSLRKLFGLHKPWNPPKPDA